MAQPSTGVSFQAAGHDYLNELLVRRGGRWSAAWRDYGGSLTNISPGSSFGAPIALDGNWRSDMYAIVKTSSGQWVYNQKPNLGFYPTGWMRAEGIERMSKTDMDDLAGLQSIDPIRTDPQKRSRTVSLSPQEHNPVVDALRYNLPLSGLLERAAGSGTYFAGESADDEQIRRQLILMHEDRMGGLSALNAFPFPRIIVSDLGSQKGNRKDDDGSKFVFTRELCPFFVDPTTGAQLADGRWSAGSLWAQSVIPGLTFVPPAPVATPTAATTASLAFNAPIGGTSPYTYVVKKSAAATVDANGVLSASPSTVTQTTAVVGSVVTASLTSLTTATTSYFQVTATDSVGNTTVSAVSNACLQP